MADPTPPAVDPVVTPTLLRRDMQSMLVYIQGARLVRMARENAISRLQGWLIYRFWSGTLTGALALILINAPSYWLSPISPFVRHAPLLSALVLLMLTSRFGALISIGRRMHDEDLGPTLSGDSITTLAMLGSAKNGLAVALLSSNAFGLVMFALFASGLPSAIGFSNGIIPAFTDVQSKELKTKAQRDRADADQAESNAEACARPIAGGGDGNDVVDTGNAVVGNEVTAEASGNASAAAPTCTDLQGAARVAREKADRTAGDLRASLEATDPVKASGDSWFDALRGGLGLASVPDLFKLLLWAFIAGFFEKLVPDMLDTLAARGRDLKKKEDAAAIR